MSRFLLLGLLWSVVAACGPTSTRGTDTVDPHTDTPGETTKECAEKEKLGQPCQAGLGPCMEEGQFICNLSTGEVECSVSGSTPPAEDDLVCNGKDDDCDGQVDEDYLVITKCGHGPCRDAAMPSSCSNGVETDCIPGDTIYAKDLVCDGVDEDCDGEADEDYVAIDVCGKGLCMDGSTPSHCIDGQEFPCKPGEPLAELDFLCDGLDEDCDGDTDEDYEPITGCGEGPCADLALPSACIDGEELPCEPGEPLAEADTSCDGVDEDCDGDVDEDYEPKKCGIGYCSDFATPSSCIGGVETACKPGAPLGDWDSTCDNVDDNCNGLQDELCPQTCMTPEDAIEAAELLDSALAFGLESKGGLEDDHNITGVELTPNGLLAADYDTGELKWLGDDQPEGLFTDPPGDAPTGMTHSEDTLWVAEFELNTIYRISLETGEVLGSFDAPHNSPRDLDFRDGVLWVTDKDLGTLSQVDPLDGSLLGEFTLDVDGLAAVEFIDDLLWIADRDTGVFLLLDPGTGEVLDTLQPPEELDEPYALTEGPNGDHLLADAGQDLVYYIDFPTVSGSLDATSYHAGGPLGDIERETCSPFDRLVLTAEPEESLTVRMVSHEMALAAALSDPYGQVFWADTAQPGELLTPPVLMLSSGQDLLLEISGLTATATGDYTLYVHKKAPAVKHIWGTVTDAVSGDPLPGATIFVDSADYIIQTTADDQGAYSLYIPTADLPQFIMASATAPGHHPGVIQVDLSTDDEQLDIALLPDDADVVVVPVTEQVHHLGDDEYSGTINSQFQKATEGSQLTLDFDVPQGFAAFDVVSLTFWMKGAQKYNNSVHVNGVLVGNPTTSPDDGSFGVFDYYIWPGILQEGTNQITFAAGLEGDDYDDFEFILVAFNFLDQPQDDDAFVWTVTTANPTGLTWTPQGLIYGTHSPGDLYTLDPVTGACTPFLTPPGASVTGIDFDGTWLWVADNQDDMIRKLDPSDGTVVAELAAPAGFPRDLSFWEDAMWLADANDDVFYKINAETGEVLATIPAPGTNPSGCEVIEGDLWTVDRSTGVITIFSLMDNSVLDSFDSGLTDPYSIEYYDGEVWISDNESGGIWLIPALK